MKRHSRAAGYITTVLVSVLGMSAPSIAAPPQPVAPLTVAMAQPDKASSAQVTASSGRVHSGHAVTLDGSGWSCSSKTTLTAYVNGVSPYPTVKVDKARTHDGTFQTTWYAPKVVDTLPWTVQAVQRCGHTTSVATTAVTVSATSERNHVAAAQTPTAVKAAAGGATTIDPPGLQFIADQEGYKLDSQGRYIVYNDPLGFCTAGYGHLLHKSGCTAADRNGPFNNLTPTQAVDLLQADANKFAAAIVKDTDVPLTQKQLDALIDFAFNCGSDAYGTSTLRRLLNQGKYDAVPKQLSRWVHGTVGKGKNRHTEVLDGLVKRRGIENTLWDGGQFPPVQHKLPTGGSSSDTCSKDDLNQPPSTGCTRITVQVIPDYYPDDSQHGLGVGVGSVTVQPSGMTLPCLNPADAGACVRHVDVATSTTVTITATAGSESPDPADPPDSTFEKFTGACSGAGGCSFTPSATGSTVDAYFIPAVVTLTMDGTPRDLVEMTANAERSLATTDPYSPVYCPGQHGGNPLPCSLKARIYTDIAIEADDTSDPSLHPTFSDNCPVRANAPSLCDITMTKDTTVTATFGD